MKKHYEVPTVEKISFNYRDQVVAASGESGGTPGTPGRTIYSDGCNIQNMVVFGFDVCSGF